MNKESQNRKFAARLSLIVGIGLLILKFWGFSLTRSQAIFSDAMESIVNVVAAILVLFVVTYANKPIDQDHPYGHGKVEHFSAAFEGGLISFASLLIIIDAILALIRHQTLQNLDSGFYIVIGAGAANFLLGQFLLFQGKALNSSALTASAQHLFSDTITSVGIAVGVVLVYLTDAFWLDSAVALVVGVFLGYTGIKIVRHSIGALMDEEDLGVLKQLAGAFSKCSFPGFIQIHHVKVIRSGKFHHIDGHVVLPEFWDVAEVHKKMDKFESEVIATYKFEGEMNLHVDPCRQVYCQNCDLKDCPIRREEFSEKLPINLKQMRSKEEPLRFRGAEI